MTQASPFFNSSLNEVLLRCLCVDTCTCGTFLLPGLAAQEQRIHLVNARIASNFHHHKEYRSSCSQRPDFFRVADENSNYWSKALFYFLFFFLVLIGISKVFSKVSSPIHFLAALDHLVSVGFHSMSILEWKSWVKRLSGWQGLGLCGYQGSPGQASELSSGWERQKEWASQEMALGMKVPRCGEGRE